MQTRAMFREPEASRGGQSELPTGYSVRCLR